ncbi:hypothetical protein MMC09_000907 [Bachmanniomyces sp. S44760]|nr:hypothetical protein [Bachmanniomyces sp. S44760]
MVESHAAADALLTEHFRYTPLSLIDDIINTVNAIVYRSIEALETGLFSTPPSALGFHPVHPDQSSIGGPANGGTDVVSDIDHSEARTEIENGVHQLETLIEATVDKNFDKFEIYTLRNILTVPEEDIPWLKLGHYENLQIPLPPSAPIPSSLHQLRRKLQETQKLNLALREESARNETLISQLRSILGLPNPTTQKSDVITSSTTTTTNPTAQTAASAAGPDFSFLTTVPTAQSLGITFSNGASASSTTEARSGHTPRSTENPQQDHQPLSTLAQFTTSQLPALRTLVASLRPALTTLSSNEATKIDRGSTKEERRRYIDSQTRGIVAREIGVSEDADGTERYGGGGSGGRGEGISRRGVEEVKALEGVVTGLELGGLLVPVKRVDEDKDRMEE